MPRNSKQPSPPVGIQFPADPRKPDENPRGSTFGNKGAWAAAVRSVDPAAAQRIEKEKAWRQKYTKYIVENVRISSQSRENALKIAQAGLDYCYDNFQFIRDGEALSFDAALNRFTENVFKTGVIKGTAPAAKRVLEVPYKGSNLSGEALVSQLNKWAEKGTIERTTADSIINVVRNQDQWLDLSDTYFVLLGAGSAMGPYPILMALGANVIAIDLDRPQIWKRLFEIAKNSPGTLTFPTKIDIPDGNEELLAQNAGANLFTDTPEIRNWLLNVHPGKKLVVGSYAYLDGELHVKVSLAMDAIVRDLTAKRKASCAYLCTPTDCHVIPKEAHDASKRNLDSLGVTTVFRPALTANALPAAGTPNEPLYIVDALVNAQGPNYSLAKRIQHWRAIIAREKTGVIVSTNIAPSTSTVSVTSNKSFAMAYKGMHYFQPLEVFAPETSNTVMTALLVNDLRNKASVANPANTLSNPLELFKENSFHGGVWRIAYKMDDIGVPSLGLYLVTSPLALSIYVGIVAVLGFVLLGF